MRNLVVLALIQIAASACSTTLVIGPDPIPIIGAQLIVDQGPCLDLVDGNTADGTPIDLFHCHGSANQRWFVRNGSISQNAGSCLEIQGGKPDEGTPVLLVTCNGSPSQRWSTINGQIVGLVGKCLGSVGNASADLTPVVLADCSRAAAQRWTVQ